VLISEVKPTLALSDHITVECKIAIPRPNLIVKEIRSRNFKQIDHQAFKSDISSSDLYHKSWTNIHELANCYNKSLLEILDKHAPLKTMKIIDRPKIPWFTDDLKKLKAERRKRERKMLQSGLMADKEVYRKIRDRYSALFQKAKVSFYTDMINQCARNPKKLFRTVNSLSKKHQDKALPTYEDRCTLAENFGQFFYRKIELINEKIDQIDAVPLVVEHRFPDVKFESFSPVSDDVVSIAC
jgi:hypothetical protein